MESSKVDLEKYQKFGYLEMQALYFDYQSQKLQEKFQVLEKLYIQQTGIIPPNSFSSEQLDPSTRGELKEEIDKLFSHLHKILNLSMEEISTRRTKEHSAAYTIDEWRPIASSLFPTAFMCKNLFMKDKKKDTLWLIVAKEDTEIDMKKLTKKLGFGSGTLRFAHEDILLNTLGLTKGSVTPLALVYDKENKVNVIFDKKMFLNKSQQLLFHPLSNCYSTQLTASELETFLNQCHPKYQIFDFDNL